jgi:thiol-disulfide isomerase/thioredoxin
MTRRITLILLLLPLLLISESINAGKLDVPFGIRIYEIGNAPNFKLNDTDGEVFELDKTHGQWVFLHFWASWCGPCREEMPAIQKLSEKIDADKLRIVMVNTSEDEDTIFTFLASLSIDINTLMDTDGEVTEVWKPRGLPTSFLIAPDGKVRYQAIGGRDWDKTEYVSFLKALVH